MDAGPGKPEAYREKTNCGAALRLAGAEDFDPAQATETLGVCPSRVWRTGEAVRNTGRRYSYTAWIYEIAATATLDLADVGKGLERVFAGKAERLRQLKERYGLYISIDFVVRIEEGETPAVHFDGEFLAFAAAVGAEIDVDLYVNGTPVGGKDGDP